MADTRALVQYVADQLIRSERRILRNCYAERMQVELQPVDMIRVTVWWGSADDDCSHSSVLTLQDIAGATSKTSKPRSVHPLCYHVRRIIDEVLTARGV